MTGRLGSALRCRPVYIVNLETKDTHEGAGMGAQTTLQLVQKVRCARAGARFLG
jgi:hypothetical protein